MAYFILIIIATYFLLQFDKLDIHVYINKLVGNNFINTFFYYITYLGDGLVAPFLILIILLYNFRLGITSAFTLLISTGVTNLLKFTIYDDVKRPWYIFQWISNKKITYVPNLDMHLFNSFPSGHSTQVFAIFMCLSFFSKNYFLKIIFFLIALLAAFSRTYLSQHWLVDITVGSIIGFVFATLFYYFIIEKNKLLKLNRGIIKK